MPEGVTHTLEILDRYVTGTRLRLREVREADGSVTRKLGHKVRLTEGPAEVAHTSLYLDEAEWDLFTGLPARLLHKRRHVVHREGLVIAVDEHDDGTLVAEIDDGDAPSSLVPDWLDVLEDVSDDEAWTGARLAR
jgi:CYTH domain-containing protein